MKYAKYINENEIEELNPDYLEYNGRIYYNPINNPEIDIFQLGYKELIVEDIPQYNEDEEKAKRYYKETANQIFRCWEIEALTEEEKEIIRRIKNLLKQEPSEGE